jgi:NAD(P)-dependent dehydrogenase (short-subunit alcohol dehydrogenase family)
MIAGDGGQIVVLAPPPGDAAAEASRAGLENLSRTLSIEWARHAIRPVTVLPGAATSPAEVAELVAFLASPAGAYYSGCAFTLGAV